jgi:ribosomal protein S18 acetylase RimI-like enzyme
MSCVTSIGIASYDHPHMPSLLLRPATTDDADWIYSQVPRLHEFGPPRWRTREQMDAGEIADLRNVMTQLEDPDRLFLIAEREDGTRIGFLYVLTQTDFFTRERHAHISDLVVSSEGEGQGAGRALLAAAEEWSRKQGHRFVTLSVFPNNTRALALYERSGYETDVHRMLKLHEPSA